MSGVTVACALGSALCFATSGVLQQRGAARAPRGTGLHLDLIPHLCRRPVWLAGLLAAIGTVVLQGVALTTGQLVLVQPLLVVGLLFALPVSVLMEKQRPSLKEWAWAAVLIAGLAVFIVAAHPLAGPPYPDDRVLGIVLGVGVAVTTGICLIARGPGKRHAAALLGFATGIAYGLSAALLKYTFTLLTSGDATRVFTSWPLYALVVIGPSAILLNQAAYQAGPLVGALPPIAITDPVLSIALGVWAFNEQVRTSGLMLALQIGGFVVMSVGIIRLARFAAGRKACAEAGEENCDEQKMGDDYVERREDRRPQQAYAET